MRHDDQFVQVPIMEYRFLIRFYLIKLNRPELGPTSCRSSLLSTLNTFSLPSDAVSIKYESSLITLMEEYTVITPPPQNKSSLA